MEYTSNQPDSKGKTLKKAVIKNWGPIPKFIKWMIDAIFMKRFTYGILVWGHILRYPTKKAAVSKLNKLADSMITPVRTSTPLDGLQVIHNMMPIHLIAMYEALASLRRNSHLNCKSVSRTGLSVEFSKGLRASILKKLRHLHR